MFLGDSTVCLRALTKHMKHMKSIVEFSRSTTHGFSVGIRVMDGRAHGRSGGRTAGRTDGRCYMLIT